MAPVSTSIWSVNRRAKSSPSSLMGSTACAPMKCAGLVSTGVKVRSSMTTFAKAAELLPSTRTWVIDCPAGAENVNGCAGTSEKLAMPPSPNEPIAAAPANMCAVHAGCVMPDGPATNAARVKPNCDSGGAKASVNDAPGLPDWSRRLCADGATVASRSSGSTVPS